MEESANPLGEVLRWAVFQGALCYARKHWNELKNPTVEQRGHAAAIWEHIWRLQRELGCPPVGLIRSC